MGATGPSASVKRMLTPGRSTTLKNPFMPFTAPNVSAYQSRMASTSSVWKCRWWFLIGSLWPRFSTSSTFTPSGASTYAMQVFWLSEQTMPSCTSRPGSSCAVITS